MSSFFSKKEMALLKKIDTPAKVQDFLNTLRFNFEENGKDTIKSPLRTFREKNAHCFEGALLGAYILSLHGFPPLLLHLMTNKDDMDHVIAPFKINGLWGALSKTNHAVLRYREPIYESIRELSLSYFHEYFLNNGKKTLRKYSDVLDLRNFEEGWETKEEDLWGVDEELDKIKHYNILGKKEIKELRRADEIEIKAASIVQYKF